MGICTTKSTENVNSKIIFSKSLNEKRQIGTFSSKGFCDEVPGMDKTSELNSPKFVDVNCKISKQTDFIENNHESFILKKIHSSLEKKDLDVLNRVFGQLFFTKSFDSQTKNEIIKKIHSFEASPKQTIFLEGTIGKYCYIIKKGLVEIQIKGKTVKRLNDGECFGELALLHEAPRSASAISISNTIFYSIKCSDFREIVRGINLVNFKENSNFVDSIPILRNISISQKNVIINNFIKEIYTPNSKILKEGEDGNCLYVIKKGEVECLKESKLIRKLQKGDYFGESSIILDSKRTLTVKTKTDTTVYSISVETLKSTFGDNFKNSLIMILIKNAFISSIFFKKFNLKIIEKCFELFRVKYYNDSVVLDKESNITDKILIIIEGNLKNSRQETLEKGKILFDECFTTMPGKKYEIDYYCDPDCIIAECDTVDFTNHLNKTFNEILYESEIIDYLENISIFKGLDNKRILIVPQLIRNQTFEKDEVIIKQSECSDNFYMIKSGSVQFLIDNVYIRTLGENQYFGERSLFYNEPRSADAIANEKSQIFSISRKNFEEIFDDSIKKYIMTRLPLQNSNVNLKDLYFVREIGKGHYGRVHLVYSKENKVYYALKSCSRLKIDKNELHNYIDLEKEILLQIDHPFIVKLVKTLSDENYIYFLMEYIQGENLAHILKNTGTMNQEKTLFFFCSILEGLNYLHRRNFMHRDIKPENIMINEEGYVKIVDFGAAKIIKDKTFTILGTPHYMSPETILGEGYMFSADIWSLSVCLYEIFCGTLPFGNDTKSPLDTYKAVISEELKFPKFITDKGFIELMKLLLKKNTNKRLFKYELIIENSWVKSFPLKELKNLKFEPPFLPKVKKENKMYSHELPFSEYIVQVFKRNNKKNNENAEKDKFLEWHKKF